MQLTIKEYAKRKGIGKGYIHRLVRDFDNKKHLLSDVSKVTKKIDAFGTEYYVLTVKQIK